MNGSYSVPTGSSRSPNSEWVRPSAARLMNRLFSAMPSSTCWPSGDMPQRWAETTFCSWNTSARPWRSKMPRRFTQPPRLVETVTSGEVVTMRSASMSSRLASSPRMRPKPSWVDMVSARATSSAAGTGMRAASKRRRPLGREGHVGQEGAQLVGQVVEAGEGLPLPALGHALAGLERGHLVRVHQPGMVVLVAGEGQAEALDGVGDEHRRHVVGDAAEGLQHRLHVVAGEVGHQRAPAPHRHGRPAARGCPAVPPISASSCRRQAAPPWNTRAE